MNAIITRACAVMLLLLAPATSQAAVAFPPTDQILVQTCFILWSSQMRPQKPVLGKDFWHMRKEQLPPNTQEDIEKILAVFPEDMAKGGFKTDIPGNCGNMVDDPGGRIARFVFSVFPPGAPSGSPVPFLQTDTFLKVPGEARLVYLPTQNLGKPEEVAASISAAMQKAIKEAQKKPNESPAPEAKTD